MLLRGGSFQVSAASFPHSMGLSFEIFPSTFEGTAIFLLFAFHGIMLEVCNHERHGY